MHVGAAASRGSAVKVNVLVVDDDIDLTSDVSKRYEGIDEVDVFIAHDEAGAERILSQNLILLVFVDLKLDETNAYALEGESVLSFAAKRHPVAKLYAMTQYPGLPITAERMLGTVLHPEDGACQRLRGFIDKSSTNTVDAIAAIIDELATRFVSNAVVVEAGELAHVEEQLSARDSVEAWTTPTVVSADGRRAEIEYLVARLFGQGVWYRKPGSETTRQVYIRDFEELAGQGDEAHTGNSGAAVFLAQTELQTGRPGDWVVIKLAAKDEILQEVGRYELFVRFDGEAKHRVELLAYATANALGALCYALAGQEPQTIRTLKSPLRSGHDSAVNAINTLFSVEWKHWYITATSRVNPMQHMQTEFCFSYAARLDEFRTGLKEATRWRNTQIRNGGGPWNFDDKARAPSRASQIELNDRPALKVPTEALNGLVSRQVHTCVCHGDFHAANVIVGGHDGTDIRLIDYAATGPGPRALDFMVLEASIRVLHAEQIDIDQAARCAMEESRIWARIWAIDDPLDDQLDVGAVIGEESEPWAQASSAVLLGLRRNFPDIEPDEAAQIGVLQGVRLAPAWWIDDRKTGAKRRKHIFRVRTAAWLDALVRALE
jgi:hypothetical protein